MATFRMLFYFIIINFLIVFTASVVATLIMRYLGIEGEWTMYAIFYSLIGFGGAFFSLLMSRYFAKKFFGVVVIDPRTTNPQERALLDMVYQMATHARLPAKPEVGIYKSPEPNAFATGPSKRKSLVAVSTGLLDGMNENELKGVVAHEVAHIANGDMVTMTLLQGLINTMVLLAARFIAKMIVSRLRERSFWLEFSLYIALQIVFSILGSIVLCYFSRIREYRADKGGARYGGVENMIAALKALQRATSMVGAGATAGRTKTAESYNYLQISGKKKANIFSTHPPLENRIARLERSYS